MRVPAFLHTHRQYVSFREFIKENELELALDSLAELAGETDHRFSPSFWHELEIIAAKIGLPRKQRFFPGPDKLTDVNL